MIELSYNTLDRLPLMQYKIIEHLMLYNEDIWKILKYDTSDALSQPNLTLHEKSLLVYPGSGVDANNFRVFMDYSIDDLFTQQSSILRVYPMIISPRSRILSDVTFCIEAFCHAKITQLNNYTNRNVFSFQQIIATLNGANIDGVGLLAFDKIGNPNDKAVLSVYNGRNYQGYSIYMSTHTGSVGD
jgi:hypothetical protein